MRLISLALWMGICAFAQDAQLDALHATLVTLHSHAKEANLDTRGARPELTVAKHQLRDWIETQLASLKDADATKPFSDRINERLAPVSVAGLRENYDADRNLLGSLGEVRFSSESGLLIVTTAVGIVCGDDESAYGYKLESGRWLRVWESEDDYAPKKYAPQNITAVHVSQAFWAGQPTGPPFVLTLGNQEWCTSSFHPVYYRVWRIDPAGPKLLIDESEPAYERMETYIVGSIVQERGAKNPPVDVLIEFAEMSIDAAAVHNREAVRHFLIDGDRVRRVDPVALSPRDFIDEWLTREWKESATWSASPALQEQHGKLHSDLVFGGFDATMHCQTPDLWQVELDQTYFLVRWRPPYRFTMMDVRDKPWPLCNQPDPEADAWRTLFSTQEWCQ